MLFLSGTSTNGEIVVGMKSFVLPNVQEIPKYAQVVRKFAVFSQMGIGVRFFVRIHLAMQKFWGPNNRAVFVSAFPLPVHC